MQPKSKKKANKKKQTSEEKKDDQQLQSETEENNDVIKRMVPKIATEFYWTGITNNYVFNANIQ